MTNTSSHPVTVDGVRLDTLAYNIVTKQGMDLSIGARGSNFVIPGRDGELWVPNKRENPGRMVIQMWVRGTDVDGNHATDPYNEYRRNLDKLRLLFGKRHALLDVRQDLGDVLGWRRYWCECVAEWVPTLQGEHLGKFSVELRIPGVYGEDVNQRTWTGRRTGTMLAGPFNGATAPIRDLWLRFHGPWVNPSIRDDVSGHVVSLTRNLSSSETWVVNTGKHSSVVGNNLGYVVQGAAGTTDVLGLTSRSGAHSPVLFGLTPRTGAAPSVTVGGSGLSGTSWVELVGRRKYR